MQEIKEEIKSHNNWNPLMDGIDHINIYSKGKTALGINLSNFARTPFVLKDKFNNEIRFSSVESWWYYKKMKNINDNILKTNEENKLKEEQIAIDLGETYTIKPIAKLQPKFKEDELNIVRYLYGSDAKFYFRKLYKEDTTKLEPTPQQLEAILRIKLETHPALKTSLKNSILPFSHYYYTHGIKTNADKYLWICDIWNKLRKELHNWKEN